MVSMLGRSWWSLVLRGVLAVIFGIVAWLWPDRAVLALVYVFGAYALVDGVFALVAAFSGESQNRWLLLLEGIIGIAAGIIAFARPGLTALTLVLVVAAWAIITGVLEIVAAVRLRQEIENEWLLGLAGLASIVFGVILVINPDLGALTLVWLIAIYAIVFGVAMIVLGFRLRGMADQTPPDRVAPAA